MKKLLSVFAIASLMMFFAAHVSAQKLMIGPRLGINLANESWDPQSDDVNLSMKLGLIAGGQLDVWFDPMIALSLQLLYDQKGVGVAPKTPTPGVTTDDYLIFNTFEIPIEAKFAFGSGDMKPYIFAGPSIGIRVASGLHLKETSQGEKIDTTVEVKDVSSIDFGILGGAGLAIMVAPGTQLFFDAAYALGLS